MEDVGLQIRSSLLVPNSLDPDSHALQTEKVLRRDHVIEAFYDRAYADVYAEMYVPRDENVDATDPDPRVSSTWTDVEEFTATGFELQNTSRLDFPDELPEEEGDTTASSSSESEGEDEDEDDASQQSTDEQVRQAPDAGSADNRLLSSTFPLQHCAVMHVRFVLVCCCKVEALASLTAREHFQNNFRCNLCYRNYRNRNLLGGSN